MTKSFLSVVWMLATSIPVLGQPLVPIQWYQICTPHVDIIFKGDIAREAQRVANTLGHLHAPIFHSLGMYNKRIALIINNQKVYINGFAQLGPYKISFNTFPTQDYNFSGSNDWLHVLATHESRHAAQYAMLKQNLNQLAYTLGGELFLGGLITGKRTLMVARRGCGRQGDRTHGEWAGAHSIFFFSSIKPTY